MTVVIMINIRLLKKLIKFGIKRNTYVENVGHNNKLKNLKELLVVTDNIADMLTRIRNANMVKHQIVQIPATKILGGQI